MAQQSCTPAADTHIGIALKFSTQIEYNVPNAYSHQCGMDSYFDKIKIILFSSSMHLVFAFNCRAMMCRFMPRIRDIRICVCVVDKNLLRDSLLLGPDYPQRNVLFILVSLVSWHYLCQQVLPERERESV